MSPEHAGVVEAPFAAQPDTDLFFPEAGRAALLRHVYADLQKGRAVIRIIGAEGTGKTMLCQMLARLLPEEFKHVLLENPGGSFDELLRTVFAKLGLAPEKDAAAQFKTLAEQCQQQGKRLLLLVDQAEKMFPAALERLFRTACAGEYFQVIVFGRPALDEHIKQLISYCADIEAPVSHAVQPLTEEETGAYLHFRLHAAGLAAAADSQNSQAFSQEAVRKIFTQAQGNLWQTNQLAAQAFKRLAEAKRRLPVLKSDVPLLRKNHRDAKKKAGKAGRLLHIVLLIGLLLLVGLVIRYNEALWHNGFKNVRSFFTFSSTEPEKLLSLPEELQPKEAEEPPPLLAAQEKEILTEKPVSPPPEEEKPQLRPAAEQKHATAAETTEQAEVFELLDAQPIEVSTHEQVEEKPLTVSVEPTVVVEEEETMSLPIHELTPEPQRKIVYLFPDRQKIAMSPPVREEVPEQIEDNVHTVPVNSGRQITATPLPVREEVPEQVEDNVHTVPVNSSRQITATPLPVRAEMPEQEVRAEEVPQAVAPTVSAPEPVSEPRPDPGMLYQQLHYAGSRLRTSVNAEKYTLQLLMLSSSDAAAQVKEMIVRDEYLDHKNQLRILRKQSLPTALFVFYGLYNTEEEAKQALESLPLFLRKHHPYVLPVKEALRKTAYLYE